MNRFPVFLTAVAAVLLSAGPVLAAPANAPAKACYTPSEFQAEQGLRLHTELMVIGLKCQDGYKEKDPFGAYRDFTRLQKTVLSAWEKRLIEYFRRSGGGNPTARFDTFRTTLANDVSRRATTIGNTDYCEIMVPLAAQAAALSEADLRRLVDDDKLVRLPYQPICGTGAQARPAAVSVPAVKKPKPRKKTNGA